MPDPLPSPAPVPPTPSVDSVTAPVAAAPVQSPVVAAPPPDLLKRMRKQIVLIGIVLYVVYTCWCLFLLAVLPDPTGGGASLVSIGLMTCLLGFAAQLGIGILALKRISSSQASIATRRRGLIILIVVLVPVFVLTIVTPFMIKREPYYPLDIVQPTSTADMIAPVSVTLSAERATNILANMGFGVTKYQWDTNGDGKQDDETVTPTSTALYQRAGVIPAVVRIILTNGAIKRITRNIVIPQAVFSTVPVQPIVEKPVKFSVSDLITDPNTLKQVIWDFGDGNPAQTVTTVDVAHTYYAIGAYPVSATVQLVSGSQTLYKRTLAVQDAPPLPFPITLTTEPGTLVGPAPFGVIFTVNTKEPLKEVSWSFGDGKEDRGAALVRESHSFDSPGIYPVVVRARSADGKLAELTSIVRVTETLSLASLVFEGTPVVSGKITGEVPLEISLKPKTTTPLVQFMWEVPDDPNIQVSDSTLTGVFRKEGSYSVVLLAQGAEGKSLRMPITIVVSAPTAEPTILLTPDGGVAPLTVTFDASQTFIPPGETVAGFKWLFGDEGQGSKAAELAAARIEHTYTTPGEFAIEMHVVFISGKEVVANRTIIVRKPTLSACITASRLSVEAGKGIQFDSSCSTGTSSSIVWDVRRDDLPDVVQAQSSDPSYIYVFKDEGDYTVTLSLKDAFGNLAKKSLSIHVSPGQSAPPASSEPAPLPDSSGDTSSSSSTDQ